MTRRSPVNFRAFVVIAVAVIGAVLCVYAYIFNRTLGIVFGCVYLTALFAAAAVFIVKSIKKTVRLFKTITVCLAAVLCLSAFVCGVVTYGGWTENYKYKGYGEVSGRVCYVDSRYGNYKIGLDELKVKGESVDGILEISIDGDDMNIAETVRCGDRLNFKAYVSPRYLYEAGSVDGTTYRTDIRFSASVRGGDISVEFGEPTFIETMLGGMRDQLVENMGNDYGNIAYSMITGDKHGLDAGISDYYSAAGLGHIMAVSGLHVGFMAALISFILSKANKKLRFAIVTAVLLFYTVIADFSPSVIRAVLMTEVYMLAHFLSGRRDVLSSTSFSFAVILAVKPLYLFELGFQLSFGAIFGIAMFGNSISRLLSKVKIPKTKIFLPRSVGDAVGTAVSVQAGIVPIEIYHFKSLQIFSLFVNIIFIPYVSVVFIGTVILLPISFIPECGVVLSAAKYLMMPLDTVARGVASLQYSEITMYATNAVFLCYPVMFVASEFFMMNKGKLSVVIMSVCAYIAFCSITTSPSVGVIAVRPSRSTDSLVCDGKIYYIGYLDDAYSARKLIQENSCTKVDEFYVFKLDPSSVNTLISLRNYVDIGTVYCNDFDEYSIVLIDNGFDVRVPSGEGYVMPVIYKNNFVGYEYKAILFMTDDADPAAALAYGTVRCSDFGDALASVTTVLANDGYRAGEFSYTDGGYCYKFM